MLSAFLSKCCELERGAGGGERLEPHTRPLSWSREQAAQGRAAGFQGCEVGKRCTGGWQGCEELL